MAKRVIKKSADTIKKDAAASRTKKTKSTATKKAPSKKTAPLVTNGNVKTPKKAKTPVKKVVSKKPLATNGKKVTVKMSLADAVKKKTVMLDKFKKAGEKAAKKKQQKEDDKYIRISANGQQAKFCLLGERVQRGEVKWSHYAIDNNVGYHHYLVLKK